MCRQYPVGVLYDMTVRAPEDLPWKIHIRYKVQYTYVSGSGVVGMSVDGGGRVYGFGWECGCGWSVAVGGSVFNTVCMFKRLTFVTDGIHL